MTDRRTFCSGLATVALSSGLLGSCALSVAHAVSSAGERRPMQSSEILSRLRSRAGRFRNSNCRTRGTLSQAPTITPMGVSYPPQLTVRATYTGASQLFELYGGVPILVGGLRRVRNATVAANGGNLGANNGAQGTCWRAECMVDTAMAAFRLGPTPIPYRFLVDDQYVDLTGTQTLSARGVTWEYILLDFTSVGGKKRRRIAVEGALTCAFDGAVVAEGDTVMAPPPDDSLLMIVVGDSLVYGAGAAYRADGWAMTMGDYLGIRNTWASGSGGTGWVAGPPRAYSFRERMADWIGYSPDVVVFAGGFNDRSAPAAAVAAEVTTCLRETRKALPTAPIFVFGTPAGATGPSQVILEVERAVQAGTAALRDPLTRFIPISTDREGPWIGGHGKVGLPSGDGNSDTLTSSDGVHPSTEGHAFLGRRAADAIINDLAKM
jgi:lysophospholipase L1-like esterase